jgi:hypothetical protein
MMTETIIETTSETGEQPVFVSIGAGGGGGGAISNVTLNPPGKSVYFPGGTLKAIEYGRVGGYLVIFTNTDDRDSYDEYFTGRTDYGLDYYRNQPVLYHHGQKDELVTPIGMIDTLRVDERGIYAEAQLDVNHEDPTIRQYARTAYAQVNAGKLFWSSGSAEHLVRITDDGEIVQWYIVEGSLTPTPAEQRGRTQVEILRAAMKALLDTQQHEDPAKEAVAPVEPEIRTKPTFRRKGNLMAMKMDMASVMSVLDGSTLSPEQKWELATALAQAEAGEETGEAAPTMADEPPAEQPPAPPAEPMAAAPRAQTMQDVAQDILRQMRTAPAAALPAGGGENPMKPPANAIVLRTKFDDLSAVDMSYMHEWRSGMARYGRGVNAPDAKFNKELLDKTQKLLSYENTRSSLKMSHEHANRILSIRSNELDNTATATSILEWIPTIWSSELWRRVRVDNEVASQFRVIEMPSDPYNLPIESTDPIVYLVPETTDETQLTLASSSNPTPDSLVKSNKVQLDAKKLGLRVGFSSEAEEDSIIPFIPQLREQGIRALANAVDNVLVNGDTETGASTNINSIDGTPAVTDKYLAFNGLLKNALVTATGQSFSLTNGKPTLANIRLLRSKLQSTLNVYGLRPDDLVGFVDPYTWFTMLSIDEINSWLNNGRNATVNNGMLPNIDGIPFFPTQEMGLANTAGKVATVTPANNTVGRIVMAAKSGWTVGYRRQVTTNVDYLSHYDSYQFTANLRIAFINKDTAASAVAFYVNVG